MDEGVGLGCVELLVEEGDWRLYLGVGVDVEEDCCCWILGDGSVEVAGRAGGTGFSKVDQPWPVGVDGRAQSFAGIADLLIEEGDASFVEKQIPEYAHNNSNHNNFLAGLSSEAPIEEDQFLPSFYVAILEQSWSMVLGVHVLHLDGLEVESVGFLDSFAQVDAQEIDCQGAHHALDYVDAVQGLTYYRDEAQPYEYRYVGEGFSGAGQRGGVSSGKELVGLYFAGDEVDEEGEEGEEEADGTEHKDTDLVVG